MQYLKKVGRWVARLCLLVVLLFAIVWGALQFPSVQTKLVSVVTDQLSTMLQTEVSIKRVNIKFFKTLALSDIYIQDQEGDTLLFAGQLDANIGLFSLFDRKITLNEVALEGAVINLERPAMDSSFNFEFILAAFASDEPEIEKDTSTTPWKFVVETVALSNVNFKMDDAYGGMYLAASIGRLDLDLELMDLDQQRLDFQQFDLDNTLVDFVQSTPSDLQKATAASLPVTLDTSVVSFPYTGWDLAIQNFSIENTNVTLRTANEAQTKGRLNAKDLALQQIKIAATDFSWQAAELNAKINNLQLREKSGLQLNKFALNLRLTPQSISLEKLNLKTPQSRIENTTSLKFKDFETLVNNFEQVAFSTHFTQTRIAATDLSYLVSAMGELTFLDLSQKPSVALDGKVTGNLQAFKAESLNLRIDDALTLSATGTVKNVTKGNQLQFNLDLKELSTSYKKLNTVLKNIALPPGLEKFGNLQLKGQIAGGMETIKMDRLVLTTEASTGFDLSGNITGLTDQDNFKFDLVAKEFYTIAEDLSGFAAQGLPKILDSLGRISYEGALMGTLTKFDLDGNLVTALGTVESDLSIDFEKNYSTADYNGDVRLEAFQLGKLLGDSLKIGEVSLAATINGDGFALDSLNAALKVDIEDFGYADYNYNDIFVKGLLEKGVFTGKLDLKDPNATIDFDGKISFNETKPVYKFKMFVDTLNLKALNLTEQALSLHTRMDMNFTGTQINDFEGEVNLTEIFIRNEDRSFQTDTLQIVTDNKSKNDRKLMLRSSFLEGEIAGDYDFEAFPELVLAYLNEYFPLENLLSPEMRLVNFQDIEKPQRFKLRFDLRDASPIIAFAPQLSALSEARITANIDAPAKTLAFNVNAREILVSDIAIESFDWKSDGNSRVLNHQLTVNNISTSGATVPEVLLNSRMLNDSMYLALKMNNDTIGQLIDLAAIISSPADAYRFIFDKEIIINNNKWKIDAQNFVDFRNDYLLINELIFSYDEQSVGIHSLTKKNTAPVPPIKISIDNFQIQALSKMMSVENTSFAGLLNGELKIIDPFDNLHYTADLGVTDLTLNKDPVGNLAVNLAQGKDSKKIIVDVALKGKENDVSLVGGYDIAAQAYNVKATIAALEMRLVDPVMVGIISESKGKLTGQFSLNGTVEKPALAGAINLENISTNVDFSKTRYAVSTGKITFNNKEINLGTMVLTDRKNDKATLSGKVNHEFFSNLSLDLSMNTNRFTFLNTQATDNGSFYGKLFLNANVVITGPVTKPVLEIRAKTLEGSEVNVAAFGGEDSFLEEDFIVFGNPETYRKKQEESGISAYEVRNSIPAEIRLNLELTDGAIFRVIVDPVTGDQLECRGNSDLLVEVKPDGGVDIFGTYSIASGKYRFSYTDVVRRNFELVSGSSVAFNGDPLNARFDVTAKYATKATPFELISNETTLSESATTAAQRRQTVEVLMKMEGDIADPKLSFDLDLPEAEGSVLSSSIQRKLVELRENQNELNRQVFGLLLFNGFIASSGTSGFSDAGESVVLGSVSKFMSNQLNQLADKYIKGVQINFDVSSYKSQYANQGEGATVTEFGVGVTKEFNDRLSLKAGGNFDLNSSSSSSSFSQIAGDFVLQYKLTESGNYLLKVFRKSDFDVLNEENSVKTGVGVSVSKSFGGRKKVVTKKDKEKNSDQ